MAVGSTPGSDGNGDLALARYNADGSLDKSFGVAGKQITDVMWGSDEALADVAIGPDGTIAAVGQSYCFICSSTMLVLAVFARDGSPRGLQLTDASGLDSGSSVAIQSDGKIVAVGGSAEDFLVARYDSGGNPDPSFHDDGVYTNLGVQDDRLRRKRRRRRRRAPARRQDRGRRDQLHVRCRRLRRRPHRPCPLRGRIGPGHRARQLDTLPTITGSATEGQTLTANPGTWSGSTPMSRSYQWRRCDSAGANCLDIAGASATTYVLVAADVGHTIRVRETATNADGQSSADSAATAVIKRDTPPANSTPPTISGTATEGQTLTVDPWRLVGQHADEPRLPVATLRLDRRQLR